MRHGMVGLKYTVLSSADEVLQFFGLQLDRGNIQNALTDNFLKDLKMTSNDYNNVSHIVFV